MLRILRAGALAAGLAAGAVAAAAAVSSADEAAAVARDATGGRVLAVQTERRGDVLVYRVKVLLGDGRVQIITVDGGSGRVGD
ncbi:MAG: peptidase [Pseudomonadota bacterium]|nr:peptidase [Pseudomonadota bacterium]